MPANAPLDLISDLRRATGRGEIVAFFQPQVDLDTLEIVAAEALARWAHPAFGLISPGIFIPLAEAHELIGEIDCFMIDEAIRCAAHWEPLGIDLTVSVNVSAFNFRSLDCLDNLERALDAASLPHNKMILEITESLPLLELSAVTARFLELRSRGLGISIDDFGAGYSSLAHSVGIPATEMKIDKSLIPDSHTFDILLRAVIASAHEQGLSVVAEGIETDDYHRGPRARLRSGARLSLRSSRA